MEASMDVHEVTGRRFGLTADTHDDKTDWPALLTALKSAWGAVDGVLHCGDITSMAALAALGDVGAVYATRSQVDPPAAPPTLVNGPRVLDVEGVRVGLTFSLDVSAKSAEGAARLFEGPVSACVHGGTHEASVVTVDGVLFINPGSPSLAKTRTAGVLTVGDGRASGQIVLIP
jgi:putative phosphoesterase